MRRGRDEHRACELRKGVPERRERVVNWQRLVERPDRHVRRAY